ncbi:enoyl-CoA hydratase/isomerase family protein [Variovorax sp. M-6]|uniref:enoyl-CoA hydratase/isomerase family protein n=1 Tax=Variovorax sp. M-6 TaxID=3233041 RepID=UPI003F98E694
MDTQEPVRLDVDDEIATITLNRADALNALDFPAAVALQRAIDAVAAAPGVRALVLRGEGRSFCVGGDVRAMHAHRHELPAFIARMIDSVHASVMALNRLPVPVIAGVHGAVAGGGLSLALACDMVLAARGTRLITAYAKLGASADGGLSFRLAQRVGVARAFDLLTLHTTLDAPQALALGLIDRVVDADRADAEARQCARALAALPAQSVRELKELTAVQVRAGLEAHLAREKAAFLRCAATADFAARVAAFAEGDRRAA